MTDQALLLELRQSAQRRLDRSLGWSMDIKHGAQIDHVEHIQSPIAEIVVNGGGQFLAGERRNP